MLLLLTLNKEYLEGLFKYVWPFCYYQALNVQDNGMNYKDIDNSSGILWNESRY